MGLTHGVNILIADDAERFAEEVIRVYNDRNLWETLSRNGKQFIEQNYSPKKVKKVRSIFTEMAIRHTVPQRQKGLKKEKIEFREPAQPFGMTSVIVLAKENWQYTRACLESLARYTDLPYEIVLVDNGSEKPFLGKVLKFKERWKGTEIKYFRAQKNQGFARGCNRGIEVSKGDYVLILNNDALVSPGWLKGLIKPLLDKGKIGITGPLSNYVYGGQMIEDCPLRFDDPLKVDFGKLSAYAVKLKEENKGLYISRIT
ncbi:MAG: glycosyltransferase [Desulfobacterota bacterium]|nr:glycosyltransferase [Thermodesulfobacteriota bacterium]